MSASGVDKRRKNILDGWRYLVGGILDEKMDVLSPVFSNEVMSRSLQRRENQGMAFDRSFQRGSPLNSLLGPIRI